MLQAVWPEKNCQMPIKVAQNNFTTKIIDFDTFTKIALECGKFGQIPKIAQSGHTGCDESWPIGIQ